MHLVGFICDYTGMHGQQNAEFGKSKQAKYKNIKTKLMMGTWRPETLNRIVHLLGFIYEIIQGCMVNKT